MQRFMITDNSDIVRKVGKRILSELDFLVSEASNAGEALLTLFTLLTLEGWNSVMFDLRAVSAAACGTPIVSDHWAGLETIFTLGEEILVARSPEDTLRYLAGRCGRSGRRGDTAPRRGWRRSRGAGRDARTPGQHGGGHRGRHRDGSARRISHAGHRARLRGSFSRRHVRDGSARRRGAGSSGGRPGRGRR